MFDKLIRRLFLSKEDRELEEHYNRQWQAAEAEIEAIEESSRRSTVKAFLAVDPLAEARYRRYRRSYRSPALAEMAAIRDAQQSVLATAFSILDSSFEDDLNANRRKRGLWPL